MTKRWIGPVIAGAIVVAVVVVLLLNVETPDAQPAHSPASHGGMAQTAQEQPAHSMGVTDPSAGKQPFMPMIASDGPHYGATVAMPGHGRYRLVYTIHPPDPNQFGRHTDPITGVTPFWPEPFPVEFTFDFRGIPKPDSEEAKALGVEVRPGFREYGIPPREGYQQHDLDIKAVWLPPIQMEGMDLPQDPNIIHLEADIHAAPGNPYGFSAGDWVPYLTVEFELQRLE